MPLLIAVDEEGGTVNRISRYPAFRSAPFPSPQQLFQAGGLPAVRADTLDKCAFLQDLGHQYELCARVRCEHERKKILFTPAPSAKGRSRQQNM